MRWTAGVPPACRCSTRWSHGGPEARGPLIFESMVGCAVDRGRPARLSLFDSLVARRARGPRSTGLRVDGRVCGGPRASRPPVAVRLVGRTAGQRPAVHWSSSRWWVCGGPRASRPPVAVRLVGRTAGQRPAVHWSSSRWSGVRWTAGVPPACRLFDSLVARRARGPRSTDLRVDGGGCAVDRGRPARLSLFDSLVARRARGPRSTDLRVDGRVCGGPRASRPPVGRLVGRTRAARGPFDSWVARRARGPRSTGSESLVRVALCDVVGCAVDRGRPARLALFDSLVARRARGPRSTDLTSRWAGVRWTAGVPPAVPKRQAFVPALLALLEHRQERLLRDVDRADHLHPLLALLLLLEQLALAA